MWPFIGAAYGVSRIVCQALLRNSAPTGNAGAGFLEVEREPEAHGHSMPLAGDGASHCVDVGGVTLLAFLDYVRRTHAGGQGAQEGDNNRRAPRGTAGHGNFLGKAGR